MNDATVCAATNQEEEAVLNHVRANVRSAENVLHNAATKLQAVYRSYKAQKRLNAVRKKRGGKGSKGKGKVKGSTKKEGKVKGSTKKENKVKQPAKKPTTK